MELAEGELAALLEEMLAKCLGYAAPREALGCLRATPWDFEKKSGSGNDIPEILMR